jgi:hypothetical protein
MTTSSSKQPEDEPNTHTPEQPENSTKLAVPTKASEWPVPEGFTVVEDGESHIFVGGFPCAPPKK